MLARLFIVSSGIMVKLPNQGLCYVNLSLLLHDANLWVHSQITETFTCLPCDSLHFCKYLYSMMIDGICQSHFKFLF